MPETLSQMWEKAKDSFEDMAGKKKPKDSKSLKTAFGSHTGLSGALAKFDKAEGVAQKTNNQTPSDCKIGFKLRDTMEAELASFKKASGAYCQTLDKAIQGDIDNRSEVDIKTSYERALKFLKKTLSSIEDTADSRLQAIGQRFDAAEKDLKTEEKMLLNWKKNMSAAVARGAAAAAKVKAKPTVATYNSIFPTAARDITMQLVFARKVGGLLADPDPINKAMGPFGRQDGKEPAQLPQTATEADVKKNLADFVKELKKADQLVHTKDAYS